MKPFKETHTGNSFSSVANSLKGMVSAIPQPGTPDYNDFYKLNTRQKIAQVLMIEVFGLAHLASSPIIIANAIKNDLRDVLPKNKS